MESACSTTHRGSGAQGFPMKPNARAPGRGRKVWWSNSTMSCEGEESVDLSVEAVMATAVDTGHHCPDLLMKVKIISFIVSFIQEVYSPNVKSHQEFVLVLPFTASLTASLTTKAVQHSQAPSRYKTTTNSHGTQAHTQTFPQMFI